MSDLPDLSSKDFPAWFEDLWNYSPFPWQEELVTQVHTEQRWPSLVDLPTGTGKTSLIDIAIFLQALDAERLPSERWMPRRIVSVVDRRVVVDQAAQRADDIAKKLQAAAAGSVMKVVADRLRHLAGIDAGKPEDPPLLVATLRGAIAKDESWMRRPDVPAVLSSTVDQAGSRLLFRGYGISRAMRPIHAGLLGNDVLWLLDEVHLARPFAQTLAQVRELRGWRSEGDDIPDRWGVVEMSATPASGGSLPPQLSGRPIRRIDDGASFPAGGIDAESHPVIGRRLRASKPAELDVVKVPADRSKADRIFATACAQRARDLVNDGTRTIGVIVNRVDTARRVWRELHEAGVQAELLTGRMRPFDRDHKVEALRSRLETGRSRSAVETPLVLVATQCIEAGADFDLDAIVTEVASLDALRQRFGRVDRDGVLSAAEQEATSVILARSADLKPDADDPVYGTSLRETWGWLTRLDHVDFGIRRLAPPPSRPPDAQPNDDDDDEHIYLEDVVPSGRNAPRLLPTHLDQLCQTSGPVSGEPDISRWLHGDTDPSPDVQVVWRADIDEELIRDAHRETDEADGTSAILSERIGACPPASTEALTVPLAAARRWLTAAPPAEVSDVEGASSDDDGDPGAHRRPWIRWRSGQAVPLVESDTKLPWTAPRPGDVIVVPAAYGGLEQGTWNPTSPEPVSDVAAEALLAQGRLLVLRLLPTLLGDHSFPTAGEMEARTRREQREWVIDLLKSLGDDVGSTLQDVISKMSKQPTQVTISWPKGAAWGKGQRESVIVSCPAPPEEKSSILSGIDADTEPEDEASSFTGVSKGDLQSHLDGVGCWARKLAEHLGLSEERAADMDEAGRAHDEGKRDPRFQLLLHGGDEVARAAMPAPLAKSRRREPSAKRRREIRRIAKYPRGARHELTSLALAGPRLSGCTDPELVAHLVASHHGWCRPFAPALLDTTDILIPVDDTGTDEVPANHGLHQIDAEPPSRFWDLNHRYGWFNLAWLEAILRLGDHRRSEWEQRQSTATEKREGHV